MSRVRPACRPSCMTRNLALDITRKVFIFFIPAMLIGTIDIDRFIPLLVTLTLAGCYKVRAKQNLVATFSSTLFKLIRMQFDIGVKIIQVKYLDTILSEN